ncbi:methyltransferase domain-containing protein [Pseudomonas fuscovaginae UPB0736]|uniref:geranyl diphosphate 2-C-methyltransferase n=1 Tax=Pseudomonas asplenii TaxID=53407 RepID=UPI0002881151|nr:geranyl diphosphate 2-C-methyltransferase [Pseudomonas fuscovaginae]UUQ64016.1 methyltransferase domain-containing protein [Pseudomonas fuscovaginae UPB0736]
MTRDHAIQTPYQQSIADYWNREQNPVNLLLGDIDGLYHHHYGIGDVDTTAIGADTTDGYQQRVTAELHRLETAQADFLLDHLGTIRPVDHLLDSGSGRGGSSLMANRRFSCQVDGISISQKQVDFANQCATERGVADRVHFHLRNMLDTYFEDARFQAVWNNESTMYVDLAPLFTEYRRILRRGGRYVTITGAWSERFGMPSAAVSIINARYGCNVHSYNEYLRELKAQGFQVVEVADLTAQTLPYWKLRRTSSLATGVEDAFIEAYEEGSFHYLLIAADRLP